MGSLKQEPPKLLQDLKITIHETSTVIPPNQTERKPMFLSNVDQALNFDVQTIHFFRSNNDFPPVTVAEKLRNALTRAMESYEYLAGRIRLNSDSGRLEIDCNGAGAGFIVAVSGCTLEEIGDLVFPNPAFGQLVASTMERFGKDDQPLCIFQVTSFTCGGFALGISTNHATFDGLSFKTFLDNLAALAGDKPLAVEPCHDRKLLAGRSPPRVTFSHHELAPIQDSNTAVFDISSENLDFKIFNVTSEKISKLKEKAKNGDEDVRVSGFNVITALIWKCKALSVISENLEEESKILYAVDIRPRLIPPLPASYTGNAVLTAYAKAKRGELKEFPFWRIAEMVREGAKRMTDEYARSTIDWGEINKGFPHGEVLVSSWWRLGFANVEYPWGNPIYSCPVVYHRKDIILLFPDIDKNSNGVNVLVALPPEEMAKFQVLFQESLA